MNLRLDWFSIKDLMKLASEKCPLEKEMAYFLCRGTHPYTPRTQIYGCYNDNKELAAIMTATFVIAFPCKYGDKVVQITGALTRENEDMKNYADKLIKAIEYDATNYFKADCLYCDKSISDLSNGNGFIPIHGNETIMYKSLK